MTKSMIVFAALASTALATGCQTRSTTTAADAEAKPGMDWDSGRFMIAGETYELYWDGQFDDASCETQFVRTFEQHLQDQRVEGPSHGTLVDMGVGERTHDESGCTVEARLIGYRSQLGYTGGDRVEVYWGSDTEPMVEQLRLYADYAAAGQALFPYSHPSERPIAGAAPVAAAFTPPPAGFSFTTVNNGSESETWTVTESGPEWSMTSDRARSVTSVGPFLTAAHYQTPTITVDQSFGSDASFMFPLAPAASASAAYEGHASDGNTWSDSVKICTVLGAVAVDIPAGSFDTYKVQCLSGGSWFGTGDPNPPYSGETFYYAPALGLSVVTHYETQRGEVETSIWSATSAGAQS